MTDSATKTAMKRPSRPPEPATKRIRLALSSRASVALLRLETTPNNGMPTLLRSSVRPMKHRPQLAACKGDEQPGTNGGHERQRQEQESIGRDWRGRHPRRVDQPEVGHAGGAFEFPGHRCRFTACDQILVVLLVDRVVAVQLRRLGLDLRCGLHHLACRVVSGCVLRHSCAQRQPPAPPTWPASGSSPGRPGCPNPRLLPRPDAAMALRLSSSASLRF